MIVDPLRYTQRRHPASVSRLRAVARLRTARRPWRDSLPPSRVAAPEHCSVHFQTQTALSLQCRAMSFARAIFGCLACQSSRESQRHRRRRAQNRSNHPAQQTALLPSRLLRTRLCPSTTETGPSSGERQPRGRVSFPKPSPLSIRPNPQPTPPS